MEGSRYPNGVLIDRTALRRTETSKASQILRMRTDVTSRGVLSGGEICVAYASSDAGTGDLVGANKPIPVSCDIDPANLAAMLGPDYDSIVAIPHNLGNDSFPYAIVFPELNEDLHTLYETLSDVDLANYTLHFDIRLGCGSTPEYQSGSFGDTCLTSDVEWGNALTNGPESAVIGAIGTRRERIPEPGALALFGLGLVGFVFIRRYRKV